MTQIIAELCQNHTGSTDTLAEMVEAAADAGADYAKIQTIFADDVTPRGRFEHGETEANGVTKTIKRPYKPEYERLADLELSIADHERFIELCEKHGVTPLTTVFSRKRIPDIASLPWPEKTIKIASYDCASVPMLRELAEHFDTFFVSTGGTYDEEVRRDRRRARRAGRRLYVPSLCNELPQHTGYVQPFANGVARIPQPPGGLVRSHRRRP